MKEKGTRLVCLKAERMVKTGEHETLRASSFIVMVGWLMALGAENDVFQEELCLLDKNYTIGTN